MLYLMDCMDVNVNGCKCKGVGGRLKVVEVTACSLFCQALSLRTFPAPVYYNLGSFPAPVFHRYSVFTHHSLCIFKG
jgi:hypothetical protein